MFKKLFSMEIPSLTWEQQRAVSNNRAIANLEWAVASARSECLKFEP